PGCRITNTMRKMQPSLFRTNGRRTLAVFDLIDRVVDFGVDDFFVVYFGVGDAVAESPAYTAAGARFDETVLWSGIECVLPLHEFRVQDDVALLPRVGFQVGQALPRNEVLRPGDAGLRHRRRGVTWWRLGILALGAKDAVDPPVFVAGEAHVVDVHVGVFGLGHHDRIIPETEVVDAVWAFGNGEEGFPIGSFDAG